MDASPSSTIPWLMTTKEAGELQQAEKCQLQPNTSQHLQDGPIVPLTREGWVTDPGLAAPHGALQVALAGVDLARGLLLATCLPRPSGPPAGTQTCPSLASRKATCKKETEAENGREAYLWARSSCSHGKVMA